MTKLSDERIIKALKKGLSSTTMPNVVVNVEQVIQILGIDTVLDQNVFNWVVETEETQIQTRNAHPSSILPNNYRSKTIGLGEVDRVLLLELINKLPSNHLSKKFTNEIPE